MSEKVKNMFGNISERYDLLNDVLSFGIHRLWRKKTVKLSSANIGFNILDCAAGTGDLSIEFKNKVGKNGIVIATDFSNDMLAIAKQKFREKDLDIQTKTEDVMNLSFPDNSFDISSIAFGIRNVDSPQKGIDEMARVVKSDGEVIVLEFGQPSGFFSHFYHYYSEKIIPFVGQLLVKNKSAYNYLHQTASKFPCREEFVEIMNKTERFKSIKYYPLTFGIAYIYIGKVK